MTVVRSRSFLAAVGLNFGPLCRPRICSSSKVPMNKLEALKLLVWMRHLAICLFDPTLKPVLWKGARFDVGGERRERRLDALQSSRSGPGRCHVIASSSAPQVAAWTPALLELCPSTAPGHKAEQRELTSWAGSAHPHSWSCSRAPQDPAAYCDFRGPLGSIEMLT
eukprot:CAMPEP_0181414988 /NCGR_PEP_ID=MMETSP1110-20121109/9786_1 /TAXON_ID=174948 /ORGANISM="Symbiodinium sp., Strain CCMP421" /LENGTH=165 /DNA_ID=CAMNT_0023537879 /DNA_START=15 /DNA_END=513 /DNA_ORIENTATION=-